MDLINWSHSLDTLTKEKLKSLSYLETTTIAELKTQINSLKYLVYVLNQDRIVISTKNLRQALMKVPCFSNISSPVYENSYAIEQTENTERLAQYDLYELNERSSEIVTVVNTSILPSSHEHTEREFSPFSPLPLTENPQTTYLTTEASNKLGAKLRLTPSEKLLSEEFQLSSSNISDFSFCNLYSMNYLEKPTGDDEISVSGKGSCLQSRQESPKNEI